jgi:hypothetical protein
MMTTKRNIQDKAFAKNFVDDAAALESNGLEKIRTEIFNTSARFVAARTHSGKEEIKMSEKTLFTPPAEGLLPACLPEAMESNPSTMRGDHSPADPHFRYFGQRIDGEKTPDSAIRARQVAFATVAEFAAWRRTKGMPELSPVELEAAFERFTGAPVQKISAGSAGAFVAKK